MKRMKDSYTTRRRAEDAMAFITRYIEANGLSPSERELADALGYHSSGEAHRLLVWMEEVGMLTRGGLHEPRSVRIGHTPIDPPRDRRNEL